MKRRATEIVLWTAFLLFPVSAQAQITEASVGMATEPATGVPMVAGLLLLVFRLRERMP